MQLIGYLESPFVRRVAVSAQFLQVVYEHSELSIFRDIDAFRERHSLIKVPTLVCDDGTALVDSSLIIEHLETISGKSLLPASEADGLRSRRVTGIALAAMEKIAQLIYETTQRPTASQHQPWIDRIEQQLLAAVVMLEREIGAGDGWLFGNEICQADITTAIAWRCVQHVAPDRVARNDYPGLVLYSSRAERLPEFRACPTV